MKRIATATLAILLACTVGCESVKRAYSGPKRPAGDVARVHAPDELKIVAVDDKQMDSA